MAAQMFIALATKDADRIRAAVEKLPAEQYFELRPDAWLMFFNGTTRQLAEDLGIRQGTNGSGFVAPITGYSGRGPADLWEWLKVKWPQDG